MDTAIQKRVQEWLTPDFDEATRKEIQALVEKNDDKELTDRFYMELEFGTAGLRGTLGAGTNRMNIYVVRKATQGLANYIIKKGGQKKGVLVGRDSRIMSDRFAEETVSVLVANGIKVYFFDDIHPTPTVSFGVRYLKAISGVMITASHNPKEYNGYKVIWEDGAQITPPYDEEIIEEVRNVTTLSQVKWVSYAEAAKSKLFSIVDKKVDPAYLDKVRSLSLNPKVPAASDAKICYTALHGTGYRLIPESLQKYGFKNVLLIEEQMKPDGNFPTAAYPNPEETAAMAMGVQFAKDKDADAVIASDPDADRVGLVLKKGPGEFALLNGNQIAILLTYYICSQLSIQKKMPKKARLVKTIVTTDTLVSIAKAFGVEVAEVLTGFKWIGLKINEFEKTGENYVFGGEESHGYLAGTFVRDKDAVIAASIIAELVAYYKSQGTTAYKVLEEVYIKYGYYRETQKSITMKGLDGAEQIKSLMDKLRKNPPSTIGKYDVQVVEDIESGDILDKKTGKVTGKLTLPASNVIIMRLNDSAKIVARPSGTEPKIKFYFTTYGKTQSDSEKLVSLINRVDTDHEALKAEFSKQMGFQS